MVDADGLEHAAVWTWRREHARVWLREDLEEEGGSRGGGGSLPRGADARMREDAGAVVVDVEWSGTRRGGR